MKIKTSELTGAALEWAVAKCEGMLDEPWLWGDEQEVAAKYKFSTNWSQSGPIIEREWITVSKPVNSIEWVATMPFQTIECDLDMHREVGATPLVAAMRCYVSSKLGDEVEIPEELA